MDHYFQISHYLDELASGDFNGKEIRAKVRKLIRRTRIDQTLLIPILLNKLRRTQDPAVASVVGLALQQMNDPAVFDSLMRLFYDPAVRDEVKVSLLPVFVHYGGDVEDLDVRRAFTHPLTIYNFAVGYLLDAVTRDENVIGLFLEGFHHLPRREQIACVKRFGSLNDERALKLLATLAEYWNRGVALTAIAAIGAIRSGKSLTVLKSLFNYRTVAWSEIEKAIQKLKAEGLTPEPLDPAPAPLQGCLVTAPDGRGSSILVISRRDAPRRYDTHLFMLNERVGIKDCHGMWNLTPTRYRKLIQSLDEEIGIYPIPYDYALTLIRDALFIARAHRALISPEFAFHRRIFGQEDLTPCEHTPVISEIRMATVRRQLNKLLAVSDGLMDEPPFDNWWVDTPEAYRFFNHYVSRRKTSMPSEATLTAFIKEVIEPDRPRLIRRLGLTIELLENFAPSCSPSLLHRALALWFAMQDEDRPLSSLPFFRQLARLTSEIILDNIAMGYCEPQEFIPEHYL